MQHLISGHHISAISDEIGVMKTFGMSLCIVSMLTMLGGSLCYMALSQVADGVEGLQMWRVAANVLNKQSLIYGRG
jgi:hypothetical protein